MPWCAMQLAARRADQHAAGVPAITGEFHRGDSGTGSWEVGRHVKMIEPMISLAFTVWSNPGVYALLLGSGVSRSAGIPTGWEITLDLIRKVAHLNGADPGGDPALWYRQTYGTEPDYSDLLGKLARSPTERSTLLRRYFEPNEEERAAGQKVPAPAHRSIARLVSKGYVRVIITPNFDRLIEKAIEEDGTVPTVISTPDSAEGAVPLAHGSCTIIKPNGDYLDSRIKNTADELNEYDARMNKLLDQVLDEYGLIVCGWSANWDGALRAAIQRCQSRRYTTFWGCRHEPEESARGLIAHRRGVRVTLRDADAFFRDLQEKVEALESGPRPHPMSPRIAAALTKKYLSDKSRRIDLHDLVLQESQQLCQSMSSEPFDATSRSPYSREELRRRAQSYEALALPLVNMYVAGCYWGGVDESAIWSKALQVLANLPADPGHWLVWRKLQRYPALLLLYAGGIASVCAGKYETFAALVLRTTLFDPTKKIEEPAALALARSRVLHPDQAMDLPGEVCFTPVSCHIEAFLEEPCRQILPDGRSYRRHFDRFEYMLALVYQDLLEKQGKKGVPADALGCFAWRPGIGKELALEHDAQGSDWPPLHAGLFDGSEERLRNLRMAIDTSAIGTGWS